MIDDTDQEVEILHLSKRMEFEGDIYDREISYMSDHQIFHRFAKNGDWGLGWTYWKLWKNLDEVYAIANKKKAHGWKLQWHVNWQPGLNEFVRQAKF